MKTSCFKLYRGPGRISIARYAPRGTPAGYRMYLKLAPRREMLKMPIGPYRDMYFDEILGRLNPQHVWDMLHEIAMPQGAEPILLCWETLRKPGEWCHRSMVADWFEERLGKTVTELRPEEEKEPAPLTAELDL